MKYWGPINSAGGINGNDGYVDGDPSTGTQGSIPSFHGFEQALRELANLVTLAGLTPDSALNGNQVAQAVQTGKLNWCGVAGGTPNALTVTLSPTPSAYSTGMTLWLVVGSPNSAASPTINCNGLGAKTIIRRDGSAMASGDMLGLVAVVFDGTNFRLMTPGIAEIPRAAPNSLTIYVRPDGNNNNDGSADTSAKALLTVQAAVDRAFTYGPGPNVVTIKLADSLGYGSLVTPSRPGPSIILRGNTSDSTKVKLTGATSDVVAVQGPNTFRCEYLTVETGSVGASYSGFVATPGASLSTFETRNGYIKGSIFNAFGGLLTPSNHHFDNSAAAIFAASHGGFCMPAGTYTIHANMTFLYWARASECGSITVSDSSPPNWVTSGQTLAGSKHLADMNGTINTSGGGVGFFPGNVAGSTQTGGQYA